MAFDNEDPYKNISVRSFEHYANHYIVHYAEKYGEEKVKPVSDYFEQAWYYGDSDKFYYPLVPATRDGVE